MAAGRIHTDLALETKEKFEEDHVEIRGVEIQEDYDKEKDIRRTVVKIKTENGARAMGRPQGIYITLEAPNMSVPDEDYHREISAELSRHLKKLLPVKEDMKVLVVGLGNREITPDALGPDVVSNLRITRHIIAGTLPKGVTLKRLLLIKSGNWADQEQLLNLQNGTSLESKRA